jgi:hypothetical protein
MSGNLSPCKLTKLEINQAAQSKTISDHAFFIFKYIARLMCFISKYQIMMTINKNSLSLFLIPHNLNNTVLETNCKFNVNY